MWELNCSINCQKQYRLLEKIREFKRRLKYFLKQHIFNSVDKDMSF
jgi:hypothetical protein